MRTQWTGSIKARGIAESSIVSFTPTQILSTQSSAVCSIIRSFVRGGLCKTPLISTVCCGPDAYSVFGSR